MRLCSFMVTNFKAQVWLNSHDKPTQSWCLTFKREASTIIYAEWMENDFRNVTAKVWANLNNPTKSYDFSKFLVTFLYAALSGGTVLISVNVTAVQLSNGTVHKFVFLKILFMKMYLPSTFILRCVRAKMICMHLRLNYDRLDYWYPRKLENCEILCTKSMESCSLVISQMLAEFHLERATYKTLAWLCLLINGLSKFAKILLLGF